MVLHIYRQNKEKPIGGCHNRLFRHFIVPLHSSGQMVVNYEWEEIQEAKEIENLDRANALFGNHFVK